MSSENCLNSLRILFYALGGGLGHTMRSLAVARQLAQFGISTRILSNSPFSGFAQQVFEAESSAGLRSVLIPISPHAVAAEVADRVRRETKSFAPQLLVVDTFPRGLGGELVDWLPILTAVKRVLISRCLPERYVRELQLQSFVDQFYDLVIWPGEPGAIRPSAANRLVDVPYPLLVRDSNELPSRLVAAERLGVDPVRPTVLWVGCGTAEECRETADAANAFSEMVMQEVKSDVPQVRLLLPNPSRTASQNLQQTAVNGPLIECLPAVDFVVGSAGYNLYWETRSLQIPSHLVARRRVYDDQSQRQTGGQIRLEAGPIWRRFREQIPVVLAQVNRQPTGYINGAKAAAEAILALA